ncbi:hypothetical protein [Pseudonocardia oroxyli]|uniref:Uncharacterized protein n=1 Tax=Pseudonocardia oroxyli TaxID=366584 RepID=A0A1G7MP10_PSEOR|nr:hypothetical protein [Pseudonocardia oroxyli]SDF63447.1 hypothetical protein SAMN05216377_1066 [Pseudonocardia oroxyli]
MNRVLRALAASAAALAAAVGLVGAPSAVLVLWIVALLVVGPTVAFLVYGVRPDLALAARRGAVATGVAIPASCVVAGVGVVLGPATAPVILVAVAAAAVWAWRHRGLRRRWRERLVAPRPRPSRHPAGSAPAGPLPARTHRLSTASLCIAWQRSFWVLEDMPVEERCEVAAIRQALLDELERRDPHGFGRWLASHPRANSDPRRHLGSDR